MSLGFHVSIGVGSPGLGPNVASASFSCSIFLPSPFPSRHFFLSPTTDFTTVVAIFGPWARAHGPGQIGFHRSAAHGLFGPAKLYQ
jgi:hypothetical protein